MRILLCFAMVSRSGGFGFGQSISSYSLSLISDQGIKRLMNVISSRTLLHDLLFKSKCGPEESDHALAELALSQSMISQRSLCTSCPHQRQNAGQIFVLLQYLVKGRAATR